ncbi:MAG: hypothetical protein ACM3Y9_07770 [Ignavibacteria bacterium]
MIAKLGFLIVVLLFGTLMFVAGTLVPENLRPLVSSLRKSFPYKSKWHSTKS